MIIHVFFAWLKLLLWKVFDFDSKKNEAKQKETNFSKGKGKGNVSKKITSGSNWTQKCTLKQTRLLCIRVAHGLPPWKIVWVMFFNWVLIRHNIFWEIEHFKGNVKKQNHLRKQLDTIVYPQTNHTIVYHDHSCFFLLGWNYSFGKPLVLIPRKMKLNN